MANDYYVYIYWRLDTNEPFYVGKGKLYRYYHLYNRGNHFNNIINKCEVAVEIVMDNLTEEQAHGIECWIINELVFEYGYSIDILNNVSIEKGRHLVNATWGGEGMSGCYSLRNKSEDELKEIYKKHSRSLKENGKVKGENNPMYGKHGKDNKNSKSVICLTTMKIFYSAIEAGEYYKCCPSGIRKCCKGKKNKQGYTIKTVGKLSNGTPLKWRYLIWKHNKRYRVNYEKDS